MNKRKSIQIIVAIIAGIALLGSGFWLGWSAGTDAPQNVVITGVTNMEAPASTTTNADFGIFWQAWQDINGYYLRTPSTTDQQKMYGAIEGMVDSLGDPYTEFFTPSDSQQFSEDIQGNFGGIGAELDQNASGTLVVVSPLKGTPAATAGLKPEDEVLGINGSSTQGMTVDAAVNMIRGAVGTPVTLSILRTGWTKPQDFTITREDIQVPTVELSMKGDVAVITLNEFTANAGQLFYESLAQAVNDRAQGLVLDLRGDPGGYLQVAVNIAGYFLKPGSQVVKEVGRAVPTESYTASGDGSLAAMPMAILIDNGSASAAEILAGALHDDRGIPLIGEHSFGKGTVQELESLSDGSSLKITVAHWVLPSGQILDHDGLQPTYAVPITEAQVAAGQDPQFDKALQVVRAEIASGTVSQ